MVSFPFRFADNMHLVVAFAMAGRFGITAVYSIVTRKLLAFPFAPIASVHHIHICYFVCTCSSHCRNVPHQYPKLGSGH